MGVKQKTELAEAPSLRFLDPKSFKELALAGDAPDTPGVRKHFVAGVSKDPQGEDRVLQFTISTGTVDRDNDTIDPHGWDLTHFNKNGVVLWAHDYSEPPIGKALATWVEGDALKSRAKFASRDLYPFADMIYRMYLEGFLKAVSVGFSPRKWARNEERAGYAVDYIEQELLEYSAVPVPANPEALLEAKSKGIDVQPMIEWASKVLDTAGGEKGLWVPRKDVEALYAALKDGRKHFSLPTEPKAVDDEADNEREQSDKADHAGGKEVIATVRLYDDGTIDMEDFRELESAAEALSYAQKKIVSIANNSTDWNAGNDIASSVEPMATEVQQLLERIERLLDARLPDNTRGNNDDGDDKIADANNANGGDEEYVLHLIDDTDHKADNEVHIDPEELASVVRQIVKDEIRRATGRLD